MTTTDLSKLIFPYFRVTYHVHNVDEIVCWFDHLSERGHPVCITEEGQGKKKRFAVWRVGRENVGGVPNNEKIRGEIVEEANYFREYLP